MDVNIDLVFCKTGLRVLLLKLEVSCLEFHIHLTFCHTCTAGEGGEGEPANNQNQIRALFSCLYENTESLPRKSVRLKRKIL